MMFDMHHIISDGVSMDIFMKELSALYEGKTLPPLKLQYKDYSEWEKGIVQHHELKKQSFSIFCTGSPSIIKKEVLKDSCL